MLSSLSNSKKKRSPLIETSFKLPADIPVLPPGMNHMIYTYLAPVFRLNVYFVFDTNACGYI